jgi:hypothetical protein
MSPLYSSYLYNAGMRLISRLTTTGPTEVHSIMCTSPTSDRESGWQTGHTENPELHPSSQPLLWATIHSIPLYMDIRQMRSLIPMVRIFNWRYIIGMMGSIHSISMGMFLLFSSSILLLSYPFHVPRPVPSVPQSRIAWDDTIDTDIQSRVPSSLQIFRCYFRRSIHKPSTCRRSKESSEERYNHHPTVREGSDQMEIW